MNVKADVVVLWNGVQYGVTMKFIFKIHVHIYWMKLEWGYYYFIETLNLMEDFCL
jgi:hypothetical protein